MFAVAALVSFLLSLFGAKVGSLNLVTLGLAFIALHLLVGMWPLGWSPPWNRKQ